MLRVYAQTRFLLVMNLVRFAFVAGLIGWFLNAFGLLGAVGVTLLAMAVVKVLGVVRIAQLMHVGVREALPWGRLTRIAVLSVVSALPVLWLQHQRGMAPADHVPGGWRPLRGRLRAALVRADASRAASQAVRPAPIGADRPVRGSVRLQPDQE